jgi:hypothetical protein
MVRTPKGIYGSSFEMRNISTTYQRAYATLDGSVQVREVGKRLWEILPRGGSAQFEKSKLAAFDRAYQLTYERKGRR